MLSLRRLVRVVLSVTLIMLGAVIILGARQYAVSRKYSAIIHENEQALFRFATVRESVTEALITKDNQKLLALIPEIEQLHSTFTRMQESMYVPAELKLSLIDKTDLAEIVINLRKIDSTENAALKRRKVQEQMRNIATHLLKYDRILVAHARTRIHGLQLIILGSMGSVVTILSFSLILLYRNSIVPLLSLTEQLQESHSTSDDIQLSAGVSRELLELVDTIQSRLGNSKDQGLFQGKEMNQAQYEVLAEVVNESVNQLNGIINYAQLLADIDDKYYSSQQKELLGKILETSAKMSHLWKNFSRR